MKGWKMAIAMVGVVLVVVLLRGLCDNFLSYPFFRYGELTVPG